MSDFVVAIGLVLAMEGILFAAFPGAVKQAMAHVTGNAGYGVADDRHRLRGARRGHGLVGARLTGASGRFSAQIRRFIMNRLVPNGANVACFRRAAEALSPQMPSSGDSTVMARFTALTHAVLPTGFDRGCGRGHRAARAFDPVAGARPGGHRRRRRKGDRRGGQHLDLAEGRGTPGRRRRRGAAGAAEPAAGLAVRGVLRGVLQEPPRPGRRSSRRRTARRAGSVRSARASSSIRPASSSPTTT